MTASPSAPFQVPATILFATDLSSRCDRALDRSLMLAKQWGAHLVALTVVEPGDHFNPVPMDALGGTGAAPRDRALRLAERGMGVALIDSFTAAQADRRHNRGPTSARLAPFSLRGRARPPWASTGAKR